MRIEAQRALPQITALAPGLKQQPGLGVPTPQRRERLPKALREEQEIALRLGPGGIQEVVPLTRKILLNPSLDVDIVQNPPHDHKLRWLAGRLEPFLRVQERVVHCDVGLDWPGERTVAPDLSVIENLPTPGPDDPDALSIKVTGSCRVPVVFEVVSSGKDARWKDEEKNPPFFAQQGVDECVLLYLPKQRKATDPPIRVFADPTPSGYATERRGDAQGFFDLRSIGVRIGVGSRKGGGETVVVLDARTGVKLPDVEESLALATQAVEEKHQAEQGTQQEAEARLQAEQKTRQAEKEKQQETEARLQAEQEKRQAEKEKQQETEARLQAEQEKRQAEKEKQQETEARLQAEKEKLLAEQEKQEAEQLNQKMAAEIERLRAQLGDGGSASSS